jgi:predicted HTH transcriptional regulator
MQQLLKDATAFANSLGGTVFIGVRDNKEVVGIGIAPEEKDRFELRLRDSIRQGIQPSPDIKVGFE